MNKCLLIVSMMVMLIFSGCGDDEIVLPEGYQEGDANFSVSQFLEDQWTFYQDQPFVLKKKIEINDDVDTGFQQLDSTFFNQIKKVFDKSDISPLKYLAQYQYEYIEESQFFSLKYTAKDPDLFTQLMVVNLAYENNKILHVYIETKRENLLHEKTQKLTFAPKKFIQILEHEKSLFSAPKDIKMNYVF